MSMLCYVLGVSPDQVKALRAKPDLATKLVMATMGVGDASQFGSLQKPLDLHKSWHMLHYLFTGSVDEAPLPGATLMSGEELGEDIGYGPVRLHGEKATAEFARFLEGLDADSLAEKMDIGAMANADIYAVSDDDEDLREDVAHFLPQLQDYVRQVAQKQGGLLIWLS